MQRTPPPRARLALLLALAAFSTTTELEAQQLPRLHLGRRLRLTEETWDRVGLDPGCAVVMPAFEKAVASFFTGRLAEGARALDEARFRLERGRDPEPGERARLGLELTTPTRFAGTDLAALGIEVAPFYAVAERPAELAGLQVRLVAASSEVLLARPAAPVTSEPRPADGWPEGDHALVLVDDTGTELCRTTVSFAADLPRRLELLREASAERGGVAGRSLALGAARLEALRAGAAEERHVPAVAELRTLERLAADLAAGADPFAESGDWLLELSADPKRSLPARFAAPARATDAEEAPRPLVIALHGMGGSEHIFFEASGAGRIVRLAQERGWLLVAPRVTGAADLVERTLEAVGELRPVDRERVFLVGHSMGASRACGAVQRSPSSFRAVALFGGAGRLRDPRAAHTTAFWIGVGTKDFARRGAVSFARALEAAEHPRIRLREMTGVEHYTILQLGLDEAFAFFDEEARRAR